MPCRVPQVKRVVRWSVVVVRSGSYDVPEAMADARMDQEIAEPSPGFWLIYLIASLM